MFHTDIHLLARVALACAPAFGFGFGFERQLRGSPRGQPDLCHRGTAAAVTSVAGTRAGRTLTPAAN